MCMMIIKIVLNGHYPRVLTHISPDTNMGFDRGALEPFIWVGSDDLFRLTEEDHLDCVSSD